MALTALSADVSALVSALDLIDLSAELLR